MKECPYCHNKVEKLVYNDAEKEHLCSNCNYEARVAAREEAAKGLAPMKKVLPSGPL